MHIYIVYIAYIADNLLQMPCELQRTDRRGGRRAGVEGEVPTGRMSNKQKLLKIIVAYLADSRGMPQTRCQGAVQWVGDRGRGNVVIAAYC